MSPVVEEGRRTLRPLPSISAAVVVAITVAAVLLAPHLPGFNAVVCALLLGILVSNVGGDRAALHPAVGDLLLKRVLKAAIVLLGATVDLRLISEVGTPSGLAIAAAVAVAFLLALPLGRALRIGRRTATLIGVGCAICGASAIAAIAPVLRAKREEIGLALATIFTFNALALVALPALAAAMGLDTTAFGTWAGVAVHDTASAVAAGFAGGQEAGRVATIVKLSRTVVLVPLVAVMAVAASRGHFGAEAAPDAAPGPGAGALRAAGRSFPWFVIGFAAMAIAGTLGLLGPLVGFADRIAGTAIVMVVAGIGLTLRWSRVAGVGGRAVLVGFLTSLGVATSTLAVIQSASGPG